MQRAVQGRFSERERAWQRKGNVDGYRTLSLPTANSKTRVFLAELGLQRHRRHVRITPLKQHESVPGSAEIRLTCKLFITGQIIVQRANICLSPHIVCLNSCLIPNILYIDIVLCSEK